ncbi:MAG: hypothetical protein J1G06_03475 [Oscillospiraceae bacterium]|nr:hypothetical protein [Oscillospiraceae bacterium]
MITDFHSHILPSFDDGAADTDTAIKMLTLSKRMGVSRIVSTSHCYPCSSADVDKFIENRERSYDKLINEIEISGADVPEIRLGCEVHLTCDITRFRGIERLCVDGTDYMLVEMPRSKWTDNTIDNVYKLSISGIHPIIAHAERNIKQDGELLNSLYMLDILVQINAGSFGISALKKFIDGMMKNKMIHLIGTDMHNLTSRSPVMNNAEKYIKKRFGTECWEYLMRNADIILGGDELSYRDLTSFSKKLFFRK